MIQQNQEPKGQTLIEYLKEKEGFSKTAYPDPGKPDQQNIGYGTAINLIPEDTLKGLGLNRQSLLDGTQTVNEEQARQIMDQYLNKVVRPEIAEHFQLDKHPQSVQEGLLQAAYNMGSTKLKGFPDLTKNILAGNYDAASYDLLFKDGATRQQPSLYAQQLGDRANWSAEAIRRGGVKPQPAVQEQPTPQEPVEEVVDEAMPAPQEPLEGVVFGLPPEPNPARGIPTTPVGPAFQFDPTAPGVQIPLTAAPAGGPLEYIVSNSDNFDVGDRIFDITPIFQRFASDRMEQAFSDPEIVSSPEAQEKAAQMFSVDGGQFVENQLVKLYTESAQTLVAMQEELGLRFRKDSTPYTNFDTDAELAAYLQTSAGQKELTKMIETINGLQKGDRTAYKRNRKDIYGKGSDSPIYKAIKLRRDIGDMNDVAEGAGFLEKMQAYSNSFLSNAMLYGGATTVQFARRIPFATDILEFLGEDEEEQATTFGIAEALAPGSEMIGTLGSFLGGYGVASKALKGTKVFGDIEKLSKAGQFGMRFLRESLAGAAADVSMTIGTDEGISDVIIDYFPEARQNQILRMLETDDQNEWVDSTKIATEGLILGAGIETVVLGSKLAKGLFIAGAAAFAARKGVPTAREATSLVLNDLGAKLRETFKGESEGGFINFGGRRFKFSDDDEQLAKNFLDIEEDLERAVSMSNPRTTEGKLLREIQDEEVEFSKDFLKVWGSLRKLIPDFDPEALSRGERVPGIIDEERRLYEGFEADPSKAPSPSLEQAEVLRNMADQLMEVSRIPWIYNAFNSYAEAFLKSARRDSQAARSLQNEFLAQLRLRAEGKILDPKVTDEFYDQFGVDLMPFEVAELDVDEAKVLVRAIDSMNKLFDLSYTRPVPSLRSTVPPKFIDAQHFEAWLEETQPLTFAAMDKKTREKLAEEFVGRASTTARDNDLILGIRLFSDKPLPSPRQKAAFWQVSETEAFVEAAHKMQLEKIINSGRLPNTDATRNALYQLDTPEKIRNYLGMLIEDENLPKQERVGYATMLMDLVQVSTPAIRDYDKLSDKELIDRVAHFYKIYFVNDDGKAFRIIQPTSNTIDAYINDLERAIPITKDKDLKTDLSEILEKLRTIPQDLRTRGELENQELFSFDDRDYVMGSVFQADGMVPEVQLDFIKELRSLTNVFKSHIPESYVTQPIRTVDGKIRASEEEMGEVLAGLAEDLTDEEIRKIVQMGLQIPGKTFDLQQYRDYIAGRLPRPPKRPITTKTIPKEKLSVFMDVFKVAQRLRKLSDKQVDLVKALSKKGFSEEYIEEIVGKDMFDRVAIHVQDIGRSIKLFDRSIETNKKALQDAKDPVLRKRLQKIIDDSEITLNQLKREQQRTKDLRLPKRPPEGREKEGGFVRFGGKKPKKPVSEQTEQEQILDFAANVDNATGSRFGYAVNDLIFDKDNDKLELEAWKAFVTFARASGFGTDKQRAIFGASFDVADTAKTASHINQQFASTNFLTPARLKQLILEDPELEGTAGLDFTGILKFIKRHKLDANPFTNASSGKKVNAQFNNAADISIMNLLQDVGVPAAAFVGGKIMKTTDWIGDFFVKKFSNKTFREYYDKLGEGKNEWVASQLESNINAAKNRIKNLEEMLDYDKADQQLEELRKQKVITQESKDAVSQKIADARKKQEELKVKIKEAKAKNDVAWRRTYEAELKDVVDDLKDLNKESNALFSEMSRIKNSLDELERVSGEANVQDPAARAKVIKKLQKEQDFVLRQEQLFERYNRFQQSRNGWKNAWEVLTQAREAQRFKDGGEEVFDAFDRFLFRIASAKGVIDYDSVIKNDYGFGAVTTRDGFRDKAIGFDPKGLSRLNAKIATVENPVIRKILGTIVTAYEFLPRNALMAVDELIKTDKIFKEMRINTAIIHKDLYNQKDQRFARLADALRYFKDEGLIEMDDHDLMANLAEVAAAARSMGMTPERTNSMVMQMVSEFFTDIDVTAYGPLRDMINDIYKGAGQDQVNKFIDDLFNPRQGQSLGVLLGKGYDEAVQQGRRLTLQKDMPESIEAIVDAVKRNPVGRFAFKFARTTVNAAEETVDLASFGTYGMVRKSGKQKAITGTDPTKLPRQLGKTAVATAVAGMTYAYVTSEEEAAVMRKSQEPFYMLQKRIGRAIVPVIGVKSNLFDYAAVVETEVQRVYATNPGFYDSAAQRNGYEDGMEYLRAFVPNAPVGESGYTEFTFDRLGPIASTMKAFMTVADNLHTGGHTHFEEGDESVVQAISDAALVVLGDTPLTQIQDSVRAMEDTGGYAALWLRPFLALAEDGKSPTDVLGITEAPQKAVGSIMEMLPIPGDFEFQYNTPDYRNRMSRRDFLGRRRIQQQRVGARVFTMDPETDTITDELRFWGISKKFSSPTSIMPEFAGIDLRDFKFVGESKVAAKRSDALHGEEGNHAFEDYLILNGMGVPKRTAKQPRIIEKSQIELLNDYFNSDRYKEIRVIAEEFLEAEGDFTPTQTAAMQKSFEEAEKEVNKQLSDVKDFIRSEVIIPYLLDMGDYYVHEGTGQTLSEALQINLTVQEMNAPIELDKILEVLRDK